MRKKVQFILLITILFIFGTTASASGVVQSYYPPSNSDFFQKKISYKIYVSPGIEEVRITQFLYGHPKEIIEEVTLDVNPNNSIWIDMSCKGDTSFEYFDANGNKKDSHTRGQSTSYLNEGSCLPGETIHLSDYNEEEKQYSSDTFGGKKAPLNNPPTADGSGGTGA